MLSESRMIHITLAQGAICDSDILSVLNDSVTSYATFHGDHLCEKPGNVQEFGRSQEIVRENILFKKMCSRMFIQCTQQNLAFYRKMNLIFMLLCMRVFLSFVSIHSGTCQHLFYNHCEYHYSTCIMIMP